MGTNQPWECMKNEFERIKYRGPDNTCVNILDGGGILAFHRLAIMGITEEGNQPMKHPEDNSLTLICNGEIYNYFELADKYGFQLQTGSDSEIILFMFKQFGIKRTVEELDGVFIFVIHNKNTREYFAGRDPFGVRPGFIGYANQDVYIASEAKALTGLCDVVNPFPPGCWWSSNAPHTFNRYFYCENFVDNTDSESKIHERVRTLLTKAVQKRMMAEREIACLLSGGLDSSLITALVSQNTPDDNLQTFSIGISGSVDLEYAQCAADYIGTRHHQIELTKKEFLDATDTVIYTIESFDTTTVRASVGNYLVSKYISEHSDSKVIFNGDGSDEVCCGYVYLKNAPSPTGLQKESERLVKELYFFDVLRSDRSISSNGLEARTPFLDKTFVKYYLSIPPELKMFDGKERLEKHILREAFSELKTLPDEILWRRKCAFSDGVSNPKESWHKIIQNYVDTIISDEEFMRESKKINHCRPLLKESYYYRKVYQQHFRGYENLIPHFWMPQWTDVTDPSARELKGYKE